MTPDLLADQRTVDILTLLWNASDRECGIAIKDLPALLLNEALFTEWIAAGLIEVVRRNHCFHGGGKHRKLVLEDGLSVALLDRPDRKRPWQLLQEAITETVEPEIRHRLRLGRLGEVEAGRLARKTQSQSTRNAKEGPMNSEIDDGTARLAEMNEAGSAIKATFGAFADSVLQMADGFDPATNGQSSVPREYLNRMLAVSGEPLDVVLRNLRRGQQASDILIAFRLPALPVSSADAESAAKEFETIRTQVLALQVAISESMRVAIEGGDLARLYQSARRIADGIERLDIAISFINQLAAKMATRDPASLPNEMAKPVTTHSPDFRCVRWHGDEYEFTPTQAACVRVLWENFEKGTPKVGEQAILELAGSAGSRLRDVFAKGRHPAWKTMIGNVGKGAFRLVAPAKN